MKKFLVLGVIVCALQVNAQYNTNDSSNVGTRQTTTTTTTGSSVPADTSTTGISTVPADTTTTGVTTGTDAGSTTVTTDTTTTNVNAQPAPTTYRETDYSAMSTTTPHRYIGGAPTGWASFVELSSGYTGNNDAIPVEGVPSSIKLLGSYYTPAETGVFDLGVGSHTQTFIDAGRINDNTTTTVMELAARYQFESRWQLGAVYNQFFDRGEYYGSNQADAMFGGLQLLKEFSLGEQSHMRLGLRAMRDINTENEDIDMAQLDLAIGFDPQ
jgi:hypothetical protein